MVWRQLKRIVFKSPKLKINVSKIRKCLHLLVFVQTTYYHSNNTLPLHKYQRTIVSCAFSHLLLHRTAKTNWPKLSLSLCIFPKKHNLGANAAGLYRSFSTPGTFYNIALILCDRQPVTFFEYKITPAVRSLVRNGPHCFVWLNFLRR